MHIVFVFFSRQILMNFNVKLYYILIDEDNLQFELNTKIDKE